ncbi:MAG TPA: tetratricopeptide repeat protein, partial [Terrimicrobiaceae bacterium]|nr:tetratricopeptide repeat protein [Terrimicrobiaceae bacterium]
MPWSRIPRRTLLASAAAVAVVLISFLGARLIHGWRVERELTAAKAYVQQRDEKNALLSLKKALLLRPAHIEARRALASLLEESTSAEAIGHRRKLVELQPQLLEPKLELVKTALRLGDAAEAARTLKMITGPPRRMPRVMELQAQVYLAQGRPDLALEIYRELVEQRPEDRETKVKLTALELESGPELDRAAARADLESLVADDEFGLLAL